MIEFAKGDLFADGADALVNPVNCVGVMGKGLALEFKKRFPKNFKAYELYCELGYLDPGETFNYEERDRFIINAATKNHWKGQSRIEYIRDCLNSIRVTLLQNNIESIAIPALGCGLGGLSWSEVKPLFDEILGDIDNCHITVYELE
jgi:O-acetyl-ADP-ribose deacetylase (regulator of RNase III)